MSATTTQPQQRSATTTQQLRQQSAQTQISTEKAPNLENPTTINNSQQEGVQFPLLNHERQTSRELTIILCFRLVFFLLLQYPAYST